MSGAQGGTECYQKGSVKRAARETKLSLKISGRTLSVEIVETQWDRKVTVNVPNDTSTHRARNYAGYYKNMPSGRHLKLDVPLTKAIKVEADGDAVTLQLKDAADLKWLHNPHRLYGPWGERERGPFEPTHAPGGGLTSELRLVFSAAIDATAFEQSLMVVCNPPPKLSKAAVKGENGDPQAPANPLLPLEGLSFVFTGNDHAECRVDREARVQALGGKVTSAVSGKTSYLVAWVTTTNKYKEALARQRDGKPGPRIVDQAGIDAVLNQATATRKAAQTSLASGAGTSAAALLANPGSSDEPASKRRCM